MQVGIAAVVVVAGGRSLRRRGRAARRTRRCGCPRLWGPDALTPLAFLAAKTSTIGWRSGIVQLGSRTPGHAGDVGDVDADACPAAASCSASARAARR